MKCPKVPGLTFDPKGVNSDCKVTPVVIGLNKQGYNKQSTHNCVSAQSIL